MGAYCIKNNQENRGNHLGRGRGDGGVPHQMCFCMLVLEEEGGLEDTGSILKGLGGADRKSAKRFLVFTESFPPPDHSSLGVRPTGRGGLCPRRTTFQPLNPTHPHAVRTKGMKQCWWGVCNVDFLFIPVLMLHRCGLTVV